MKRLVKPVIISALIIAVCLLNCSQRYLYLNFLVIPQAVNSIKVSIEHTDEVYPITDRAQINRIVGNLDSITFKKGRLLTDTMGTSFNVTMLDKRGNCVSACTIYGPDIIEYDHCNFFSDTPSVDYMYLIDLTNKMRQSKKL